MKKNKNILRGDWNILRGDWNILRGDWNILRGEKFFVDGPQSLVYQRFKRFFDPLQIP